MIYGHMSKSSRHDHFAEYFAKYPDLVSLTGNRGLLLHRGNVTYGGTLIAKRLNDEIVAIPNASMDNACNRTRSLITRALKAEGYARTMCIGKAGKGLNPAEWTFYRK